MTLVNEPLGSVIHSLIRDALAAQRVETSDQTECYLIALLAAFLRTQPDRLSRALGPELLSASAASLSPTQRYTKLKDVADTSLFLSGIFLDHVESLLPTTEYFFEIGTTAYLHLGSLEEPHSPAGDAFADTFTDLGTRFEDFVRVLSAISDGELFASNERILGMYQRWLRSGSQRDAHRLVSLGIIPTRGDGSKIQ